MSFAKELKDANAGFQMGTSLVDKSRQRGIQTQQLANQQAQVNNDAALVPAKASYTNALTNWYTKFLHAGSTQPVDPAQQAGATGRNTYLTTTPGSTPSGTPPSTTPPVVAVPPTTPVAPATPVTPSSAVPNPTTPDTTGQDTTGQDTTGSDNSYTPSSEEAYAAGGIVTDDNNPQDMSMPSVPRPRQPSYRDTPLPVAPAQAVPTGAAPAGDGTSVAPADYPVNDAYQASRADISGGYNMGVGSPPAQAAPSHSDPDNFFSKAVAGGLGYIQHAFGLNPPDPNSPDAGAPDTGTPTPPASAVPDATTPNPTTPNPSAVPTAAANPNHGVMMLAAHSGSMSDKEYDEGRQIIDPKGDLDDQMGNIAYMNGLYNFYLSHGDLLKANQASATLIMTLNRMSSEYGGRALDAIKAGKYADAAQLLKKGYGFIPNGYDVNVQGNNVTMTDPQGNIVHQGAFSPQQLFDVATGMKSSKIFWGQMIQQAAKATGMKPEALGAEPEPLDPSVQSVIGGATPGTPPASAVPSATPAPDTGASPQTAGVASAPVTPASPATPSVSATPLTPGSASAVGAPVTPSPVPTGVPIAPVPGDAPAPPQAAAVPVAPVPSTTDDPNALPPAYTALAGTPPTAVYSPEGRLIPPSPPLPAPPIDPARIAQATQMLGQFPPSTPEGRALNKFITDANATNRAAEATFAKNNPAYRGNKQLNIDTFKPGKMDLSDNDNTSGAIEDTIKNTFSKLPAPDGSAMKPDDVPGVVGEGTFNNLSTIASSLRVNNPSNMFLADPKRAAQTALNLAYNPHDPLTPNFKRVGITSGGEGQVIETNSQPPQRFVLPNQDYVTLVQATIALHAKYTASKSAQGADADKGKSQTLNGIKEVGQGIANMPWLSAAQAAPWHALVNSVLNINKPGQGNGTPYSEVGAPSTPTAIDVGNRGPSAPVPSLPTAAPSPPPPHPAGPGPGQLSFQDFTNQVLKFYSVPQANLPGLYQSYLARTKPVTPTPASAIPNVPNFQMPMYVGQ